MPDHTKTIHPQSSPTVARVVLAALLILSLQGVQTNAAAAAEGMEPNEVHPDGEPAGTGPELPPGDPPLPNHGRTMAFAFASGLVVASLLPRLGVATGPDGGGVSGDLIWQATPITWVVASGGAASLALTPALEAELVGLFSDDVAGRYGVSGAAEVVFGASDGELALGVATEFGYSAGSLGPGWSAGAGAIVGPSPVFNMRLLYRVTVADEATWHGVGLDLWRVAFPVGGAR